VNKARKTLGLILTIGALIACAVCVQRCGSVLNRSSKGRAYLDKKAVVDYFESIKKADLEDDKYWCNPADIKFRFKDLSEFIMLEIKAGYESSGGPNSNWSAFKMKIKTRSIWGGVNDGLYWVYVKIMPDGTHKIFALKPEKEAAFWESVSLSITSRDDPCGFPGP
jgi:hypothetical protein